MQCGQWVVSRSIVFFFNDTATTEIYTLSLHDALPISATARASEARAAEIAQISDEAAFEAAARRFSVAGTAARGGA